MTDITLSRQVSPLRLLLAFAIGLTAFRLAALMLTGLELHGDEAQYWSWAQRLDWGYFTKPPMIAWVIAGAEALCGDAAACIRAPSPVLHALTALALFWMAREVFHGDERRDWIGFWAGALWLTLPAVSWSSLLVSTDVPLLLFWSVAVAGLARLMRKPEDWTAAVVAGIAIGLGLLSKYAMAYAFLGLVLFLATDRPARAMLRSAPVYLTFALALAILSPNILWNLSNEFATVRHLGDNANLKGELFHPDHALEFLGQQFGVFGPVPFAVLLWRLWAWTRGRASRAERLLLAVALPPLLVVTVQALLSRANANWAVTAFPTATVLVAAWLVMSAPRWAKGWTIGPHLAGALALLVVAALWPAWRPPLATEGLARLSGWEEMARQIRPALAQHPDLPVLIDDRMNMAALLYTMRHELVAADRSREGVPGRAAWAWDWNFCPEHHYEQTSRFDPALAQPIILLSGWEDEVPILQSFETAEPLGIYSVDSYGRRRTLKVFILDGYRGHWTPPEGRLPCEPPAGQGLLQPDGD